MQIDRITIRDRGPTPRRLAKVYTASSKESWSDAAKYFHATYRPRRFTKSHGREAGYRKRKGEDAPFGSREYWRSYVGRKLRKKKHDRPLEYSGRTKSGSAFATIVTTRVQARVKYPQVRVLNFRPDLQAEFRKMLPHEGRQIGRIYDRSLDKRMKADKGVETRTL